MMYTNKLQVEHYQNRIIFELINWRMSYLANYHIIILSTTFVA